MLAVTWAPACTATAVGAVALVAGQPGTAATGRPWRPVTGCVGFRRRAQRCVQPVDRGRVDERRGRGCPQPGPRPPRPRDGSHHVATAASSGRCARGEGRTGPPAPSVGIGLRRDGDHWPSAQGNTPCGSAIRLALPGRPGEAAPWALCSTTGAAAMLSAASARVVSTSIPCRCGRARRGRRAGRRPRACRRAGRPPHGQHRRAVGVAGDRGHARSQLLHGLEAGSRCRSRHGPSRPGMRQHHRARLAAWMASHPRPKFSITRGEVLDHHASASAMSRSTRSRPSGRFRSR